MMSLMLISINGCATKVTTVCLYDPITLSKEDKLTRETKKQIYVLNKNWEKTNN